MRRFEPAGAPLSGVVGRRGREGEAALNERAAGHVAVRVHASKIVWVARMRKVQNKCKKPSRKANRDRTMESRRLGAAAFRSPLAARAPSTCTPFRRPPSACGRLLSPWSPRALARAGASRILGLRVEFGRFVRLHAYLRAGRSAARTIVVGTLNVARGGHVDACCIGRARRWPEVESRSRNSPSRNETSEEISPKNPTRTDAQNAFRDTPHWESSTAVNLRSIQVNALLAEDHNDVHTFA